MKYVFALIVLTLSLSSIAGTCKLSGTYYNGFDCTMITTKLDIDSESECRELAESTRENRFFNLVTGKREKVLKTKYVFKEAKKKIQDIIEFEDTARYCW